VSQERVGGEMKNEGMVEAGLYSDVENVCVLNRASHVGRGS